MSNTVGLIKTKNNPDNLIGDISRLIDLTGYKPPSKIKTIVIKLNLCYYWKSSSGHTTDPELVSALIDYLREKIGSDVEIKLAEADASAMQTKYAFPLLGYTKLAAKKKVELFNLSEDEVDETEIEVGSQKMTLKVPKTLLNSDLFINVPKLKVMRATHITCAMKNLFGAIAYPRKAVYHSRLAETIVGINKILKPDLNIVDGMVALGSSPVRLNLLMAGVQSFSVDWIAAKVMGYNPSKIEFLKLAERERLGNRDNIVTVGEKVEDFSKIFPVENNVIARVKMRMQLSILKSYCNLVGDIIPPSIEG